VAENYQLSAFEWLSLHAFSKMRGAPAGVKPGLARSPHCSGTEGAQRLAELSSAVLVSIISSRYKAGWMGKEEGHRNAVQETCL